MTQQTDFWSFEGGWSEEAPVVQVANPKGYRGLYRFHKYWGKKPFEPISFLIETMTDRDELVLDPFVGSGVVARESARLGRRFIGIDLNPIAVRLSKFMVCPPPADIIRQGLAKIESRVRDDIEQSYTRADGVTVATHYLWDCGTLREIWRTGRGRKRQVYDPTEHDLRQCKQYDGYQPHYTTEPKFFDNSRINASEDLTLHNLFTGRALRNIDLLVEAIRQLSPAIRSVFDLCLTASLGQMSNMVFAITRRGKTKGKTSKKIEVGSWVIGYWRPDLHFEINVWSRFNIRAKRLIRALEKSPFSLPVHQYTQDPSQVLNGDARIAVACDDALAALSRFASNSVDLILTDPPHGDRVPYLELSEMWNAVLGHEVNFQREIVVSNASDRQKGLHQYQADMNSFLNTAADLLKTGGFLVILFNARKSDDWQYLLSFSHESPTTNSLQYLGYFPVPYSARSVVQDSREGSLKDDLAVVFHKSGLPDLSRDRLSHLQSLTGWSTAFPTEEAKE